MLDTLLLLLLMASWGYWLVACCWVGDFFRKRQEPEPGFVPPVSILKPVKGVDAQAYENFASFCRQDYADYELIFGVADPSDPVLPVIERLRRDFPDRNIRLVVAPLLGSNHKASILHALANQARHEVLVVCDSDMRVTPDYLRRVVAPLADEHVGLVTCLYRGELTQTFTAGLEALHMGVTFIPAVIIARRLLDMRFAMGSTVVLRKSDLARLGGFAALVDYLADDYQLGVRIASLGLRVHLSDYIVVSVLGATTFREQWDREVRWAQCSRISRPSEYPGLLFTYSVLWAVALVLATDFASQALMLFGVSLLLRWWVAWMITAYIGDEASHRWMIWLPVRDILSALIWWMGLLSRHVVWRGAEFVLQSDGRMQSLASFPRPLQSPDRQRTHVRR